MVHASQRDLVLVVCAEAAERLRLVAALRACGYAAASAVDAASACAYLRAHPSCKLVVSETLLPGESGFLLLDRVTLEFSDVGVILLTSPEQGRLVVRS